MAFGQVCAGFLKGCLIVCAREWIVEGGVGLWLGICANLEEWLSCRCSMFTMAFSWNVLNLTR